MKPAPSLLAYHLRDWPTVIFWRILKRSFIFRMWYRKHIAEVCFDMEIADIDQENLLKKYRAKLDEVSKP